MKADQWSVESGSAVDAYDCRHRHRHRFDRRAAAWRTLDVAGLHQDDETTGDLDWLQVSKQTAGTLAPGALRRQRRRSPLPRGSAGGVATSQVALTPGTSHIPEPTHAKRAPSAARGREAARPVGDALARTPRTSQILCTHSLRAREQGGRCVGG